MNLPYYEDFTPSMGARQPRAAFASGARRLSLNGVWRFHLSPTIAEAPERFMAEEFDDTGWDELPVPSHWVLHGHGAPIYTNIPYPFPIDPPRTPDDNPTGDHRLRFD